MTEGLALVTGASSGIGFEIARCFARDGHALIITSDDGHELEQAARDLRREAMGRVETVVADLAEPDGAAHLYHEINRDNATPDFLAPFAAKMRTALTSVLPESMITAMVRPE